MVRSPNLIRRPRGVFVTRLMNSDGGNYSRRRGGLSNRVREGWANYPAKFQKEREVTVRVSREQGSGGRERMKGGELSRKIQEKVLVGC